MAGRIESRNKEYFGTEKKVLSCENLKFLLRVCWRFENAIFYLYIGRDNCSEIGNFLLTHYLNIVKYFLQNQEIEANLNSVTFSHLSSPDREVSLTK